MFNQFYVTNIFKYSKYFKIAIRKKYKALIVTAIYCNTSETVKYNIFK